MPADLSSLDPALTTSKMQLLAVGLDDNQLASFEPLLGDSCHLRKASYQDPPSQLARLVAEADTVLLAWGGARHHAEALLRLLLSVAATSDASATKGKRDAMIYLVGKTGETTPRLKPKEEARLRVSGWFHLPGRFFEVRRLVFDWDPTDAEPADDDFLAELNGSAARKLKVEPQRGSKPASTVRFVEKLWTAEANLGPASHEKAAVTAPPHLLERACLYHPDAAFALAIAKQMSSCGIRSTTSALDASEVFGLLRGRGTNALVLWFEEGDAEASSLLDHLAEARDLSPIPVLILVAGQAALIALAQRHSAALFDTVAIYGRSRESLFSSLQSMLANAANPDTAKSLVTQLRRPFLPGASPDLRLKLPLAAARALTTQLSAMPGKSYWSNAELIPYLLLHQLPGEAMQCLEKMVQDQPHAITTVMLRQVVAFVIGPKKAAADELARVALRSPQLTVERIYRVGSLLLRWRAHSALADLIDGWFEHPALPKDHQMLFLAAGYYRLLGLTKTAGALLSDALRLDPFRNEYLGSLPQHLIEAKKYDVAISCCRLIVNAGLATVDDRVRLAQALVETRRFKEAREQVTLVLQAEPELKVALELQDVLAGRNQA